MLQIQAGAECLAISHIDLQQARWCFRLLIRFWCGYIAYVDYLEDDAARRQFHFRWFGDIVRQSAHSYELPQIMLKSVKIS